MKGFKRLDTIQVAGGVFPSSCSFENWYLTFLSQYHPWSCRHLMMFLVSWMFSDSWNSVKGCKRDGNIFFQRVEVHCLPSSKILFCKNSEQLAEVNVLHLTLKICRWLYPNPWLALHNISIQDYLWPVGGARTYPVSTPPLADSHSLRTSATTCLLLQTMTWQQVAYNRLYCIYYPERCGKFSEFMAN